MEKKNFWIAVGGGFVAGIGTALIVSSLCCAPAPKHDVMAEHMPHKIEMMKKAHQARHHHGDMKMMKGEHGGKHHFGHFGKRPEITPEMKAHFAQKLGLTDEQKEQLEKFRAEDMAKMEPLFKQMDELRSQMDELRKVNRAHFESVLTDEQKEILKTMKPKHHHRHHHRHHPRMERRAPTAEVAPESTAEAAPAEAETTPELVVEEVTVTEEVVAE